MSSSVNTSATQHPHIVLCIHLSRSTGFSFLTRGSLGIQLLESIQHHHLLGFHTSFSQKSCRTIPRFMKRTLFTAPAYLPPCRLISTSTSCFSSFSSPAITFLFIPAIPLHQASTSSPSLTGDWESLTRRGPMEHDNR